MQNIENNEYQSKDWTLALSLTPWDNSFISGQRSQESLALSHQMQGNDSFCQNGAETAANQANAMSSSECDFL